jgi:hypothetical protein
MANQEEVEIVFIDDVEEADKKTIVFRDETDGLDEVLKDIATSTIQNNWYRKGNRFRDFTKAEIKQINKRMGTKRGEKVISGWSYLYEKDGTYGGICLYDEEYCNPSWAFGYDYYKSKGWWDKICKSCGLKADTHSRDERVECGTLIKSLEIYDA